MKLILLLIPFFLWASPMKEYKALTFEQKQMVRLAYNLGSTLVINGETYGKTIAAFVLTESAGGLPKYRFGDDGQSAGLTQITIYRARELLALSPIYNSLLKYSDKHILTILAHDPYINLYLCMLNFKLNYERFGSYRAAIVAHNGYAPSKGFYNQTYYNKFVKYLKVVELILKEN